MSTPNCKVGDRIRLAAPMQADPSSVGVGAEGVVVDVGCYGHGYWQIGMKWDTGRTSFLVPGDQFEVVPQADVDTIVDPALDEFPLEGLSAVSLWTESEHWAP